MLFVNGKEVEYPGECTISQLLNRLGYRAERTAVERNGEIVPRKSLEHVAVVDGDHLEVVSFVGGG
ncbi:MAG: sulfur carrier protein ThiS [Eubacteriales bacterium]|nr:sulfur carrier protein ThiS [Eubacteriales bacterium]